MKSKHDIQQEAINGDGVTDLFSQDTTGLPEAMAPETIVLHAGLPQTKRRT